MANSATFRSATVDDVEAIVALWSAGGVDHNESQDRAEIVAKLDYDGDLFLVGESADLEGRIVASVMGTYDGHRGRIKRCVIDPACQGSGLSRQIVEELERRFAARGITELRLEVWADNTGGQAFWATMGWNFEPDIRYYTRSLS